MKNIYILILICISNLAFSQRFDTIYIDKSGNITNHFDFDFYKIIQRNNSNTFDVSEYYKGDSLKSTYTLKAKTSATVTNKNILKLISKNRFVKNGEQTFFINDTTITKKLYWKLGVVNFGPVYYQDNAAFHISDNDTIYSKLEKMPQFQGGDLDDFRSYVQSKVIYPEIAAKNKIQGEVRVQFIVYKDGSIKNTAIVKGVDPALDLQAFKAVKEAPNWTPGYYKEKPVSVQFVIPVNFILK